MTPASAKAKGAKFQREIREQIQQVIGVEKDDVLSRSMGANGTDIMLSSAAWKLFPYAVECKRVERLNLNSAWDQAEANSGPYNTLVFSKRSRRQALVTMTAEHFFSLYKIVLDKS
jgi:hypothetical protein